MGRFAALMLPLRAPGAPLEAAEAGEECAEGGHPAAPPVLGVAARTNQSQPVILVY